MTNFDEGTMVLECDQCGAEGSVDGFDWKEAMNSAKALGWINRNINGSWHNFCKQECCEDFKSK